MADLLRAAILEADDGQPVRVPPDRELCAIHNVSRITIRKAMELLKREGLIDRAPSRGTLSVPAAVRQYKRLGQDRVIHLVSSIDELWEHPDYYYGQVCQGILERSRQAGYRLSAQQLSALRTTPDMTLQMPEPDKTLGVIFIGLMNEVMIQHYTDAGLPVVSIDYWTTNTRADAVVIDCYGEGQTAAEFLLRHGHSHLFFAGTRMGPRPTAERESDAELLLAGMQRTLIRAGLPPMPSDRTWFIGNEDRDARQAVEWFLALRPRPTAGLVFSFPTCEHFIRHLEGHGLRCPEDVSLITKVWDGVATDLTCLRGPAQQLGRTAVDALLDRAADRRTIAMRVALPPILERGRSVRHML